MANPQSTKFAAFQFYPSDFLTSSKVGRMSMTEIGIYMSLLCYAWLDNGLPTDPIELSKLTKIPLRRFKKIWSGVLGECFIVRGGRYVNPRQERQRKELTAYVASCRRGGENSAASRRARSGSAQPSKSPRSDHRSEAQVTPNTSSSSSSSSSKEDKNTQSAPIHTTHRSHAACGRICVPAFLHTEFVCRRNHLHADKELRDFYTEIEGVWSTGAKAAEEPGDPVVFWRGRYSEKWPAAAHAVRDNRPAWLQKARPTV